MKPVREGRCLLASLAGLEMAVAISHKIWVIMKCDQIILRNFPAPGADYRMQSSLPSTWEALGTIQDPSQLQNLYPLKFLLNNLGISGNPLKLTAEVNQHYWGEKKFPGGFPEA